MRLLTLILVLLLSGCGFHLKGYQQLSPRLDGSYVSGSDSRDSVAAALRLALRQGGARLADGRSSARQIITVGNETFRYRSSSVDANGKTIEYQLDLGCTFSLTDATGRTLLDEQSLSVQRPLAYSGGDELGRRNEAALLRSQMQQSLAEQIVRRIESRLK